ncbi:MAG: hypothetical protein II888_04580 [Clostridia bacterium]|nr:hypothetical protein [Clostridia bacterium]
MIRKFISALMICCLLAAGLPAGARAGDMLPAEGFDFDFTLRLQPEAASSLPAEKAAGYAALLGALRFEGSFVRGTEQEINDLNLRITPVSWPEGAIDIRLHGPKTLLVLTSNLFGEKRIRLSTYSLLNFCSKMAEHLGLPLQYVGLAYPYTWVYACQHMIDDWNHMLKKEQDGVIPDVGVRDLWDAWSWRVHDYVPFHILIDSLCKDRECEDAFRAVMDEAVDYFGIDFAQQKKFQIRRGEDLTTWENFEGKVFFRQYYGERLRGMELDLPRMKTGYQPVFSVKNFLDGDWQNSQIYVGLLGREDQPDLLDLKASTIALPAAWPADCDSLLNLDLTGTLLPNLGVSCYLAGEKNGHVRLEVHKPTVDLEPGALILTVEGTLLPKEGDVRVEDLWLNDQDEAEMLDVLIANDSTIREFMPDLVEPFAKGILKFLIGIPTQACQVIMDDLTDLGVFSVLMDE